MNHLRVLIVALVVSGLLTSCLSRAQQAQCPIEELLLRDADFPRNTIVDAIESPIAEHPEESAGRTAGNAGDLLYESVSRYRSKLDAESKYSELVRTAFETDLYRGPWERPDGLSFTSATADAAFVACGPNAGKDQCRMIAQYDDYVVFFFSYISDQGITLDRFEDLLYKVDERLSSCQAR